jgi:hypothetical protein
MNKTIHNLNGKYMKKLLLATVLTTSLTVHAQENSGYEAMKSVYCYTYFTEELNKPKLIPEKIALYKEKADIIFPYYRDGLEGLIEIASKHMIKDAKTMKERNIGLVELFLLEEACTAWANEITARTDKKLNR